MLQAVATIQAPATTAWRLLTDTQAWPQWGPSVRAVDSPVRFIAAGTRGRVQTALGAWLPFRVTRWESDVFWAWSVAGIPATGHRVTLISATTCEVAFTVPAWAPFYLPVCHAALRRLNRLAAGE
jgi:hypothetical protein